MKTFYKTLTSVAILAMVFLTSCLDDSKVGIEVPDFKGSPAIVDFNEAVASNGLIVRSMIQALDNETTKDFEVIVNLSSPKTLDKDLSVTIGVDLAAVDAYIAANPTVGYTHLNSAWYSFTPSTVVIPAGSREVAFTVSVKTGNLTLADKPLVAFTIMTVSEGAIISGNYGTAIIKVGVKNFFEGLYDSHVIYRHPSYGTYPDNIYSDRIIAKDLATVTSNTCWTKYGVWSDRCDITILPDNSVTLVRASGGTSMGDPYRPDLISHYDPATRTIYLYYYYGLPGAERIFWETMEFVR